PRRRAQGGGSSLGYGGLRSVCRQEQPPDQGVPWMKACVTGATGFLGAHLVRHLRERGHEVRVTYRTDARLGRLGGADVEAVKADVLEPASMRRAVKGCDLLSHTAGCVG